MQAPRLLRSVISRQVGRRSHGYDSHAVRTTVNDLPTPQGSWKTDYDSKQTRYNAYLIAGIGVFIGTVVFGKAVGYLDFHSDIPARPADIAKYK